MRRARVQLRSQGVFNRVVRGNVGVMADRFDFMLDSVQAAVVGRAVNADVRRFLLRIRNSTVDPVRYTKLAILVRDDLERAGCPHPSAATTGRAGPHGGAGAHRRRRRSSIDEHEKLVIVGL